MSPAAHPQADTVPPMPQPTIVQSHMFEEMREMNDSLRDSARRIENAARNITAVAETSAVRLTRNQRVAVAGTALGLVASGVIGTLVVQRIRRRSPKMAPTVSANTK